MQKHTFDPNMVYTEGEENFTPKTHWTEKIFSLTGFCNLCLIITIGIFGYSFLGDVTFKIKHAFPQLSEVTYRKINTDGEPVQKMISKNELKLTKGENDYTEFAYDKIAEYSISGMVVAINTDFWLRGLMRNDFDNVSLMDIGIVWGKIADKAYVEKHLKFKSEKTSTARWLRYKYECRGQDCLGFSYIKSHIAHTHLVPANDNVMSALLTIKKYDKVKLDGYLVDLYFSKGGKALTSISRTDNNAGSRGRNNGGGACEIMLVEQVQIKDGVYR